MHWREALVDDAGDDGRIENTNCVCVLVTETLYRRNRSFGKSIVREGMMAIEVSRIIAGFVFDNHAGEAVALSVAAVHPRLCGIQRARRSW